MGIDVSKAQLDGVLLREAKREGQTFTHTPTGFGKLDQWLRRRGVVSEIAVCLEATGAYSEGVAEYLVAHGYRVSVVNPARIKQYAESQLQRNKTDRRDAALIADYCRRMQPDAWTPPPREVRELHSLVRHLADLVDSRQQAANRLASGTALDPVQPHLKAQLALLDAQIMDTKRAMADHLNHHPDLKHQADLVRSIPGLGDLTIAKLIAECRDLRAFRDVRPLVAFAGLNPRHHQSGVSVLKKPTISRTGSSSLRAALYMPALVAIRYNPIIHAFADRLRQRGLSGKAIVVAAMRKLLHLVLGVLKSDRPFDPNFAHAS